MFRKLSILFAMVLLTTLTATVFSPLHVNAGEKVVLGLYYPPTFQKMTRHVAVEKGFMAKQGLDVKVQAFTSGLAARQAMVAGHVDFGGAGLTETIVSMAKGANTKIIMSVNGLAAYIVAVRDHIKSHKDLEGKRFAISRLGAISHTFAEMYLEKYGVDTKKVKWTPVGGISARASAIVAGNVDGCLTNYGIFLRIKEEPGIKKLGFCADVLPPTPLGVISTSTKIIEKRPELVQKFVNGMLNGVRYCHTPEGKKDYMELAKKYDKTLTRERFESQYKFFLFSHPDYENPNGGVVPRIFQMAMGQLIKSGKLKKYIPLHSLFESRFVNQYLAENGWYNKRANKTTYLTDLIINKY